MKTTRAAFIFLISAISLGAFLASLASAEAPPSTAVGAELEGSVSDESGAPLGGAVVSVFGKNLAQGALIAVTDEAGEFQLDRVPPGVYRLRAYLSGFLPSSYARVVIEEGVEEVGSVLMSLAALEDDEENAREPRRERTLAELNWLVAHGDRNVLKSDEWEFPRASLEAAESLDVDNPNVAIGGEFGVRVASYDQGLTEFPGGGAGLDGQLAYARLFIPTRDDGEWMVSAQVLESALSSWAGRAEFVSRDLEDHTLRAGVTYGNFLYGDLEEFRPPEAALTHRHSGQRSTEWFGSVYASDAFMIGATSIDATLAYEYYGFLRQPGYASPSLAISHPIDSSGRTVFRGDVDYRVLAPGGEDIGLLSRLAYTDVYGPSVDRPSTIRAEQTARYRVGLEQSISNRTLIGVRVFEERAFDQLVKVYSKDAIPHSGAGHFVVGNAGSFRTRGVGLSLSQRFGAMEGYVGYRFGKSRVVSRGLPASSAPTEEEIHDVTTAVATSIERTRTRLHAAYRFISHPTISPGKDGFAGGTSQDARFNIQVFQVLPFAGWNGTSWELMVAVRNLFYEDIEDTSILDEIAVIDAPRRVLGGVTVRF